MTGPTAAASAADTDLPTRYCIIGAGPTGLIAARAFIRRGIEVDILERNSRVGGIWDIDNPGTPMYESCSMITSRISGGFVGYPMSADLAMYPKWSELFAYIQDFAHEYHLDDRCEFGVEVTGARPVDTEAGRSWEVELSTGETRRYRGVFSATGSQWNAQLPEIEGMETFTGRAIHSKDYHSPDELRGKRVLVVGAGNSGIDIASDAAFHADAAFLSTRRPYHFFPKQLFGLALPDLLEGRGELPDLPSTRGLDGAATMELILATVGDLSVYGLPRNEGPIGETHPIVSNTILHAFSHGLIAYRPDVVRIDGDEVEFADGSRETIDVIVYATGYGLRFDMLPEGLVEYDRGHPKLHLETFLPGVEGFYSGGTLHAAIGSGWTFFDVYANLAAADAQATLTGERAEELRRIKDEYRPDLKGGFPFLDVSRNVNQADGEMIARIVPQELRERFGIDLPTGYDDDEFYDALPRRSREEAAVAAA